MSKSTSRPTSQSMSGPQSKSQSNPQSMSGSKSMPKPQSNPASNPASNLTPAGSAAEVRYPARPHGRIFETVTDTVGHTPLVRLNRVLQGSDVQAD
ncbi:MAG: hypothetical protein OXC45_08430, partial [Gemmatimonadetes bacterium]|nr:hypothetical protein [Gemmatimonadota bacterium]